MKRKLARGAKSVLPSVAYDRLRSVYHRGREKTIVARYGNLAQGTRVIAVVGDQGKTTTALLIDALLRQSDRSTLVITNSGDGGYDDSISSLKRRFDQANASKLDFVIVEVTERLVRSEALAALSIDTVVVTNDSPSARELLTRDAQYAVLPDDLQTEKLATEQHQTITFGKGDTAETKVDATTFYRKGTELHLIIDHHTHLDVATFLVGRANSYSVAAAVATAYVLDVSLDDVKEGLATLESVPGNYQYATAHHPYNVVIDRARTDASIKFVIESARELTKRRLIVALDPTNITADTLEWIKRTTDRLVVVSTTNNYQAGIDIASSPEEAWGLAGRAAKQQDTVLLIGQSFVTLDINGDTTTKQKEDADDQKNS